MVLYWVNIVPVFGTPCYMILEKLTLLGKKKNQLPNFPLLKYVRDATLGAVLFFKLKCCLEDHLKF